MLGMKHETAHNYYLRCNKDGRAVLAFHPTPDEFGDPQPKLWLCQVGAALFACDDVGPEKYSSADYGFLERVTANETVIEVRKRYKQGRDRLLAIRRDRRKRASFIYHQKTLSK